MVVQLPGHWQIGRMVLGSMMHDPEEQLIVVHRSVEQPYRKGRGEESESKNERRERRGSRARKPAGC